MTRDGCGQYLSRKPHGCPCGWHGDANHECTCSPILISRYQKRLSGPLLDRIDIHVDVPRVPFQKLSDPRCAGQVRAPRRALGSHPGARRSRARDRQTKRFAGTKLTCNADMGPTHVRDHCPVDETSRQLLGTATPALHQAQ